MVIQKNNTIKSKINKLFYAHRGTQKKIYLDSIYTSPLPVSINGVYFNQRGLSYNKRARKRVSLDNRANQIKQVKGERTLGPSSGYIGPTRFDLLVPIFFKTLSEYYSEEQLHSFISLTARNHDKFITHHGIIEGTAKWKAITLYATGLLEGRDPENPGWVSTGSKDRWPKALTHLRPLYHFIIDNIDNEELEFEQTEVRRFLLTLFNLSRVCNANRTLDALHGLKSKFKLDPKLVGRFERFARNYLAEVREGITLSDLTFNLFLGPSNGPNGKPKLETAAAEAEVLLNDELLSRAVKEMCVITNNTHFLSFIERIAQQNKSETSSILLRRLSSIADKGNKSRIIAICDFVTQSILQPLEKEIIKVTSTLFKEECCYFSHSSGWNDVQSVDGELRQELVSLDASSWTDNLPASLQYIVMKAVFGQKLADAWYALAVKCPWYVSPKSKPIYYGKGQGMGTKGSFAIAQLTDLIFIEFSLGELYPNQRHYFRKVGDDLVVRDPDFKLKSRYESIGVPINVSKTKFKTKFGSFSEFVSRNSWKSNDYSLISPGLVSKFLRNDHYAPTLYHHMAERMSIHPTFNEILAMKEKIILKGKPNKIDLAQRKKDNILFQSTILDIVNDNQLVENHEHVWGNHIRNGNNLSLFFENLVLSTLGALVYSATMLLKDRKALIAKAKSQNLLTSFNLFSQDGPTPWMEYIESNSMSLEEAAAAQQTLSLAQLSQQRYDKGIVTDVPKRALLLNDAGCIYPEPESVKFLLTTQDKLLEVEVGYKTITRLSMFDKANTHTVLALYRYLNWVSNAKEKVLDLETGRYLIPYKREPEYVMLNIEWIRQYIELFKFDGMLETISNIQKIEDPIWCSSRHSPQGDEAEGPIKPEAETPKNHD